MNYTFMYKNQEITVPNELVEKIRRDAVIQNEERIRALNIEGCRDDINSYLTQQDDDYFEVRGRTKEEVLNDKDLIDRLTMEHYKCVFDYGVEREYSCAVACDAEPGIELEDEEDDGNG